MGWGEHVVGDGAWLVTKCIVPVSECLIESTRGVEAVGFDGDGSARGVMWGRFGVFLLVVMVVVVAAEGREWVKQRRR